MKKKRSFEEVEKRVEENLIYDIYYEEFDRIRHRQIQNEWLKTPEGINEVGTENAEKNIKENELKVLIANQKLAFLKSLIIN